MAMMGVSLRAYARMRGCSLTAVQKAIASKRITTLPDGTIDPERANQEWAKNTFAGQTIGRKPTAPDAGACVMTTPRRCRAQEVLLRVRCISASPAPSCRARATQSQSESLRHPIERAAHGAAAAHWLSMAADIARWQERRELPVLTRALVAPPGEPLGEEP